MGETFPAFDPAAPILIVGAGVMGAKVAWACARRGIPTRVFDVDTAKAAGAVALAAQWSGGEERERVARHLVAVASLQDGAQGVQLAFENVPEKQQLKCEVAATVGALAPAQAYLGTNASVLPCSPMAHASGRPERFFNMNFSDPRTARLTEVMTSPLADPATVRFATDWARHIGMIPVVLGRENIGYSMNRMWRVIKKEALRQVAEGISTPDNIDRAWMLAFEIDQGPFAIMDAVGLHTVHRIEQQYFELTGDDSDRAPDFLTRMIEQGQLGEASGRGFYDYPDPAYRQPAWLHGGA